MGNNIKTWVIGLVVVAVIALLVVFAFTNKPVVAPTNNKNTQANSEEATPSSQDVGAQDTGVTATPISYAAALVKYADRRIQLDTTCQAHPNTVTYKDNTGIMIDNRSAQTRTVTVGSKFTIKPWGFKIMVLPDVYLKNKTILVDCDGYQNVATILVQE